MRNPQPPAPQLHLHMVLLWLSEPPSLESIQFPPSSRNLRVHSQNSRRPPGTCSSSLLIGQFQVLWVTMLNINSMHSDKLWIQSPFLLKLRESISMFATQSLDWYMHFYTFNFMQAIFREGKFISDRYGKMSYRSVPAVRDLCESTPSWHENIKTWN